MTALLDLADLQARWSHYTRQGVYKVRKWPDFPPPFLCVGGGKNPLWHVTDIMTLEQAHPELTSNTDKLNKVAGYRRALAQRRKAGG